MKKALSLAVAFVMALSLAACGGPSSTTPQSGSQPASEPASQAASGAEIAMITDKGDIDDKSFNQGTWEGIQAYCDENGKTCQYYKPVEATSDAYIASIEQAVKDGAKVIVTPGFLFEVPIYTVQDKYPDVNFILIDGYPNDGAQPTPTYKTGDNAVGIKFSEQQVGYLAGYAAVMDGHTKLGFLGGQAVPAVVNYGYGYVQGANDAAKELGVNVEMMYTHTDGFAATPEAQAMAAAWYQGGTEIIFGCGGSVGNSVFKAAEGANGLSIGVDIDQSGESETVVTSAMKGLASAVSKVLDDYYAGNFPGGQDLILGAADNAVSLSMDTARFEKFDQAAYDALYAKLASGEIEVKDNTAAASADQLGTENCKVTVVTM